MAFIVENQNPIVSYISDDGVSDNAMGYIALDKLLPVVGGSREQLAATVATEGNLLTITPGLAAPPVTLDQADPGLIQGMTFDIELEPGTIFVFYLVRDSSQPITSDNLLFSEEELNVGLGAGVGLEYFRENLQPGYWGWEDLPNTSNDEPPKFTIGTDGDYNDLEVRLANVVETDLVIPL